MLSGANALHERSRSMFPAAFLSPSIDFPTTSHNDFRLRFRLRLESELRRTGTDYVTRRLRRTGRRTGTDYVTRRLRRTGRYGGQVGGRTWERDIRRNCHPRMILSGIQVPRLTFTLSFSL